MGWLCVDCDVSCRTSIQIRFSQQTKGKYKGIPAVLPFPAYVSIKHPALLRGWSRQQQQEECRKSAHIRRAAPRLTEPASPYEVDRELWEILDMATDEELERIHGVLFGTHRVGFTCDFSLRVQDCRFVHPSDFVFHAQALSQTRCVI
jgi:hypothetical protein